MRIRRAENRDVERLFALLRQVLELHAAIRPDIFVSGTAKYGPDELKSMISDDMNPIYVAADEDGTVLGYAFCRIKGPPFVSTMIPRRSLFIDDLCVDSESRGRGVGTRLFEFLKGEARRLGCGEITLNVWTGNDNAGRFYDRMGMTVRERVMELSLDENE